MMHSSPGFVVTTLRSCLVQPSGSIVSLTNLHFILQTDLLGFPISMGLLLQHRA